MVTTILSLLITLQNNIVSINDLVKESHSYHNQEVVIEAEVILEVLERDDYAWLNVNDGTNAIGIYLSIEMTKDLNVFGDYNHKGDIVLVKGVFSRNCDEHGGEIDIHATSLTIVKEGYKTEHDVSEWKFIVAIISFTSSIIVFLIYRSKCKNVQTEE